ncbi:MAG: FAD binding domain-containing protein [Spirochaetota bacterium]
MSIERFHIAQSIDEAMDLLAREGDEARILAGGTDLLVALRAGVLDAGKTSFIDVSRIPELSRLTLNGTDGQCRLGSCVTHHRIASDAALDLGSIILGQASYSVGSPQIRKRGTIGGNILTAAQCADTIPALLVLDAQLDLRDTRGNCRTVAIKDFFPAPKKTAIKPDELLLNIRFLSLAGKPWKGSYYKLMRRAAVAKSRLNFAVLITTDLQGKIGEARISIGSTLPIPGRFTPAEEVLKGNKPSVELARAAADACTAYMIQVAGRRWSAEYKEPVVRNLVKRGILAAFGLEAQHGA